MHLLGDGHLLPLDVGCARRPIPLLVSVNGIGVIAIVGVRLLDCVACRQYGGHLVRVLIGKALQGHLLEVTLEGVVVQARLEGEGA